MRRCHRVHVINLAVRSAPVVIRSAVPARDPGLFKDRFRAGGVVGILVFSYIWGPWRRGGFFLFLCERRGGWGFSRCLFMFTRARQGVDVCKLDGWTTG